MGLLECHECEKEVSSNAATCPHCGAPVVQPNVAQTKAGNLATLLITVGTLLFLGGCSVALVMRKEGGFTFSLIGFFLCAIGGIVKSFSRLK